MVNFLIGNLLKHITLDANHTFTGVVTIVRGGNVEINDNGSALGLAAETTSTDGGDLYLTSGGAYDFATAEAYDS